VPFASSLGKIFYLPSAAKICRRRTLSHQVQSKNVAECEPEGVRFKVMVKYFDRASFVSLSPPERGEGRGEGLSPHI